MVAISVSVFEDRTEPLEVTSRLVVDLHPGDPHVTFEVAGVTFFTHSADTLDTIATMARRAAQNLRGAQDEARVIADDRALESLTSRPASTSSEVDHG